MVRASEMILAPSLLSSDFGRLAEELERLEKADIQWAHWDVMDGMFVPNLTLGPPIIKALRKTSRLFFDAHLMIEKPERYIEEFADAGCDSICVHVEATYHLERVLSQIAEAGAKPAVALNPATPISLIEHVLPQVHMVLIMSVNPGFGGQKFIPFSKDKIAELARMREQRGLDLLIQVDGGVSPDNAGELCRLGADVLVSGSAFFGHPPLSERHALFQSKAQNCRTG